MSLSIYERSRYQHATGAAMLRPVPDRNGCPPCFGAIAVSKVSDVKSAEVRRFVNRTLMAHPMHVHGVHMVLLSRDGASPAAYERGLRDNFVVEPIETVSLAVQTPAAASPVPLMFHCQNLEHEGNGMIGQFIAS